MDGATAQGIGPIWTPHWGEQSKRRGRVDRDSAGIGRREMDRKTVSEDTADSADLDARLVAPLDISTQELLDEIVASVPKPLQPGEVTRKMVEAKLKAKGINLAKSSVQERLKKKVAAGELESRPLPSGEIAYRRAE